MAVFGSNFPACTPSSPAAAPIASWGHWRDYGRHQILRTVGVRIMTLCMALSSSAESVPVSGLVWVSGFCSCCSVCHPPSPHQPMRRPSKPEGARMHTMDQLGNSESALGVRDSPIWFLTLLFWRRVGGGFVLCVEYGDTWDERSTSTWTRTVATCGLMVL